MHGYASNQRLTRNGVSFTLQVDAINRECFISQEALFKLAATKNIDATDALPMDIFHAFENSIITIAYRLFTETTESNLLMITSNLFN